MGKLSEPKLAKPDKRDFVRTVQELCNGLTVFACYAILWLLIGAFGYRLFLWIF
jgi:hypothetical protein